MTDKLTDVYFGDLKECLTYIARSATLNLDNAPAPNRWAEMTIKDFDTRHGDFTLVPHPERPNEVIFKPLSTAGTEWAAEHLPADCPRFGERSYIFETRWKNLVLKAAMRDRLTEAT